MSLRRREILIVMFSTLAALCFIESGISFWCESRWVTQAEFGAYVDSQIKMDGATARARSVANNKQAVLDARQDAAMIKFTEEAAAIRVLIEEIRSDLNKLVPVKPIEEVRFRG